MIEGGSKMSAPFSELLRIDPLTGCKNYLGFLETLANHSLPDEPTDEHPRDNKIGKYRLNSSSFSAIIYVDMNDHTALNKIKGETYGNSILRWMGILLREECNSDVYRLGGDEFAVILKIETREEHMELIECIFKRMRREARQLGFTREAADIALVFFDQTPNRLDTILINMDEAMTKVKEDRDSHFMTFNIIDFIDIPFSGRGLILSHIHQVLEMGKILDGIQEEAYTDAISGLPNMKAALLNMEKVLESSKANQKTCSILMIDGDNIRLYNSINYAAGDEMIRDMSMVLKSTLRPSDYIARWRVGDEFMVILPDTPLEGAKIIGERFRLAIKEASKSWLFPTTISIGIAGYPTHGDHVNALIDKAESANKHAKGQGKDQLVLAD
jgi:diguanylate cyclase (GGDEF)-like protein